jgi:flagellar FliL protein
MAKAKAKDKADEEEKKPEGGGEAGAEGAENPEGVVVAPAKSKKKKIIIAAVALVVLLGGGVGGFLMFSKKTEEHKVVEEVTLDEHGNPINKAVYYTMPQFLVNLNASGKSQVFLKTTVVLEVAKATDVPFIESNLPRLVDGINTYLRELRSSDLAGSAGIQRLREEILLRVNKAIAPVQINDVLFKEIIVQ